MVPSAHVFLESFCCNHRWMNLFLYLIIHVLPEGRGFSGHAKDEPEAFRAMRLLVKLFDASDLRISDPSTVSQNLLNWIVAPLCWDASTPLQGSLLTNQEFIECNTIFVSLLLWMFAMRCLMNHLLNFEHTGRHGCPSLVFMLKRCYVHTAEKAQK